MLYKTSELTGALLDAAVSKACGCKFKITDSSWMQKTLVMALDPDGQPWWPSQRWEHGGPIIERERIATEPNDDFADPKRAAWLAWLVHPARADGVQRTQAEGPTPLIAAMRAYVASKLGDNVEL